MKKLISLLLIVVLFSCSKNGEYKPDARQVSCERCISIETKWQEPEMVNLIERDTLVNTVLCEGSLLDFKRIANDTTFKICNTNGEAIYWVHYKDTSFISK